MLDKNMFYNIFANNSTFQYSDDYKLNSSTLENRLYVATFQENSAPGFI